MQRKCSSAGVNESRMTMSFQHPKAVTFQLRKQTLAENPGTQDFGFYYGSAPGTCCKAIKSCLTYKPLTARYTSRRLITQWFEGSHKVMNGENLKEDIGIIGMYYLW
jgi:hypothetical protein